jgi:hypothetical protein
VAVVIIKDSISLLVSGLAVYCDAGCCCINAEHTQP